VATESKAEVRMDSVDREIVCALLQDGRLTYQQLARLVHLSANSVADRVRRLNRSGLISGYHAHLDLLSLGRSLIALSDTKLHPDVDRLQFESDLKSVPQVLVATHTTGEYDYLIRVACRGTQDLEDVIDRLRAIGVREIQSRIVLSEVELGPSRLFEDKVSTTS
jgi:Lrp/AsnC family transcriptional regulator, leucine-responsive regulatory protein